MDRNDPDYKKVETEIFGPDRELIVNFSWAPVFDQTASDAVKRPIFVDRVHITTKAKGVRDFISRAATAKDQQEHPYEWNRFLEQDKTHSVPVTSIPGIKPCEIEMFHARNIHTLQGAAAVETPDPELEAVTMRARRWLIVESGQKPRIKLEAAA